MEVCLPVAVSLSVYVGDIFLVEGVCGMKLVYDRRPPRAWREGVISLITKKNGRELLLLQF